MWDFSTDPEFQAQLDWMDELVRNEIEPLDVLFGSLTYHSVAEPLRTLIGGLKAQVRERGLWACHLGPELGGQGYGQLKLALMNEILGRSSWAPIVFGCAAPDTGNAERPRISFMRASFSWPYPWPPSSGRRACC